MLETIRELRAEIVTKRAEAAKSDFNQLGNEYLQTQLKNFESGYLQGKVDRPAARVFLKRLAEFERRWPEHPELDWVRRMKERYADMVDLGKPATYEDIEFEVKSLTWANPRNYAEALGAINRWLEGTQGDTRAKGLTLLDATIKARDEWVTDRMYEARHQYTKNQVGQAVHWLVVIICFCGDPAQADKAAEELLKFDQLPERLRGYRTRYPEWWTTLSANRVMSQWLREHPID